MVQQQNINNILFQLMSFRLNKIKENKELCDVGDVNDGCSDGEQIFTLIFIASLYIYT